jgi:hypothetical protein
MRIAEGRTRICGRSEESIFRKSRGRRPYYEISVSTQDSQCATKSKQQCFDLVGIDVPSQ